jgi:hypothetical protein
MNAEKYESSVSAAPKCNCAAPLSMPFTIRSATFSAGHGATVPIKRLAGSGLNGTSFWYWGVIVSGGKLTLTATPAFATSNRNDSPKAERADLEAQ